jgi:hypothetical protein
MDRDASKQRDSIELTRMSYISVNYFDICFNTHLMEVLEELI